MLNTLLPADDETPTAFNRKAGSQFDDDVSAVIAGKGVTVHCLLHACDALRDPRLGRKERAVLAAIIEKIGKVGTAWPSRETLAAELALEVKSVRNALYKLKSLGYLTWEKRPVPGHRRNLVQYTFPKSRYDRAKLQDAITEAVSKLRESAPPAGQARMPGPQGNSDETAPTSGHESAPPAGQETALSPGQQELSTETIKEPKGETRMRAAPSASPIDDFSEVDEQSGPNALWSALRGQGLTLSRNNDPAAIRAAMARCPWISRLSCYEAAQLAALASQAMSEVNKGFWPTTQALSECARRYFAEVDRRKLARERYEAALPRYREWQRQYSRLREIEAMVPRPPANLRDVEWRAASEKRSAKINALMAAEAIDLDQFKADKFSERPPTKPSETPIQFTWQAATKILKSAVPQEVATPSAPLTAPVEGWETRGGDM